MTSAQFLLLTQYVFISLPYDDQPNDIWYAVHVIENEAVETFHN